MSIPQRPRVVVTGAGSGLGRAFCTVLAERGARVIASDISLDAAEETARLCRGEKVHARACDVAKLEEVERLALEAEQTIGGVDVVINNAGVAVGGLVGEIAIDDWRWLLSINLMGVIHGCHVFVPRLRKQQSGHVINVASAAGLVSAPGAAPYNVSKAGVVALSETLYAELINHGVGVSVLCPTFFSTNIAKSARLDENIRGLVDTLLHAGKKSAEDVARAALAGAENGELYVVPMADGRWMWRAKRMAPQRFQHLARMLMELGAKRMGFPLPL